MADQNPNDPDFSPKDEENYQKNGLRQYGVYSAIVFQMLATMGLAFWGGNKLTSSIWSFIGGVFSNVSNNGSGFLGRQKIK